MIAQDVKELYLKYDHYERAELFFIVSWGASGSKYIQEIINKCCINVFCFHGGLNYIRDFFGISEVDIECYAAYLSMIGSGLSYCGDIHSLDSSHVQTLLQNGYRFKTASLVRDPFPRLVSQFGLFRRKEQYYKIMDLSYVDKFAKDCKLNVKSLHYRDRLIMHGINMLNKIIEEVQLFKVFRIEDLTAQREIENFMKFLMPEVGVKQFDALDSRVNSHACPGDLESWELKFDHVSGVLRPDAIELYKAFGYDMAWAYDSKAFSERMANR